MKPLLLLVFICLQSLSYAQLTFEEVPIPKDFNIAVVRQSPTGEYFVQASNDRGSIYTSVNAVDWKKTSLPAKQNMSNITFFADGTPVIEDDYDDITIRRNDIWYALEVPGAWGSVKSSFIKGDTLFMVHDGIFAYSVDKGQSFKQLFTAGINIHSADVWKINNHFVLHHSIGATDYLSVYNEDGQRVYYQTLEFGSYEVMHNDCGQVLFFKSDTYFLFDEQDFSMTSGNVDDIFPEFSRDIIFQDDHYYLRQNNTIYKSTGCNFDWEAVISGEEVLSKDNYWVNDEGDIFLYHNRSDFFSKLPQGANSWENQQVDIDYAYVREIDEAGQGHHLALTSNALFSKNVAGPNWETIDSIAGNNYQIQYSPDGDLYINRRMDIVYSADNGSSFSTIPYPDDEISDNNYNLQVLGDNVLFADDGWLENNYYSINNGVDWIPVNVPYSITEPLVKLVGNFIIVAALDFEFAVTVINISTQQSTTEVIGDFYISNYYGNVIQDDGTLYFLAQDLNGNNEEGLFRYRIGEGLEYVGQFGELALSNLLTSSGNDVYAFGDREYYSLNGNVFESFSYSGLPADGYKDFSIAENEYVYVIIDHHSIYRSTEPLGYPQRIYGSIYHDSSKDCEKDTTDATLQYWQVKVESDQFVRIKTSDSDGYFNFSVPRGAYTLSAQPYNFSWDLCEPVANITIDENRAVVRHDFSAIGLRDCADLELDFSTPLLRRCFQNFYSVRVRNTGPEATAGTTLTMKLDPFFEFISASIPYTLVGDSIVKFDLGVLAVNDEISFKIFFKVSCDAALGMEHCMSGILTDDNICGGDRTSYIECQENIGSYDPNDKRVFNQAGEETERIDKGEYIYYHIRFQNTGTDTAFTVRVVDPLSPRLDLRTLEMLSASHSYEYFISDGPDLVVLFNDVLLPDSSTNEPASHGFLKFRVKPLPEFDYGTSIPNKANIYFDFNEPVVTNEATMFILPPVATKEIKDLIEFTVFPNPATNVLSIAFLESYDNHIDSYEIIDHLGRRITLSAFSTKGVIPVAHLAPGMYNLMLKENERVIGMKKFVRL